MKQLIVMVVVAGAVACDRGAATRDAVPAAPGPAARVDCAISAGPCTSGTGDATVILEIGPRPVRSMADLVFVVSGPAAATSGATGLVDLTMPGMYMGKNEVQLAPDGAGHLTGKGVMVRCPSGHLTWAAAITVRPAGGAPVRATFTFDLAE